MSLKSKLSTALGAIWCALALNVGAAKADTFDISGTFAGGAGGTLSGTLTIDVTTGSVTGIAADYFVNGMQLTFPKINTQNAVPGGWLVTSNSNPFALPLGHVLEFEFTTPPIVPPTLGTLVTDLMAANFFPDGTSYALVIPVSYLPTDLAVALLRTLSAFLVLSSALDFLA